MFGLLSTLYLCICKMCEVCVRFVQDVCKVCARCVQDVRKTCARCLQDVHKRCARIVQDLLNMCARCAKDVCKMFERCAQDVRKMCARFVQDVLNMCSRCVQGMRKVCARWAQCVSKIYAYMSCLISLSPTHLENIAHVGSYRNLKNLVEFWRNLNMHALSMQFMQKYCLVLFFILNTEWKWKWIMNVYRQDCSKFEKFEKVAYVYGIDHDEH